jgi:hypothetical protein
VFAGLGRYNSKKAENRVGRRKSAWELVWYLMKEASLKKGGFFDKL